MVYRKKYRKRRRARPITYRQVGSKIISDVAKLRALINVEFHTLTTGFPVDPNSTGSVVNLTAIAQGDTIASRQGQKIRLKYLMVRGNMELHASATSSRVRLLIVRDNNGSTNQPAIIDLFNSVATFASNQNKLGDPQTNSRFSFLMDKMIYLNAGSGDQKQFKFSVELDHHCFFTGTAASDEGKGALYLFIASNEATNDPIVSMGSMVKWIDN